MSKSNKKSARKFISLILGISLIFSNLNTSLIGTALAGWGIEPQPQAVQQLPQGLILKTSPYQPLALKGLKVYSDDPLKFDFLLEEGDTSFSEEELKTEAKTLIEYFLTCLTLPEDELWVNLSPYEKDKIIPEQTGLTEMGKGLLEQDYLLKKLTSSLMYPETDLGKDFWQKVYQRAYQLFKTTKLPINTFNKVWIIPDKAVVYEEGDRVVIGENHLKVMLESDYLALKKREQITENREQRKNEGQQRKVKLTEKDTEEINDFSSQIVKEVIIPAIEEEVNTGKNFATLRQMYSSFILATWFKKRLKEHLLSRAYVDQKKLKGVDTADPALKEQVYQQYLSSYKEGVYNYIKSDYDPNMHKTIKRRYYSGGIGYKEPPNFAIVNTPEGLSSKGGFFNLPEILGGVGSKITQVARVVLTLLGRKGQEPLSVGEKKQRLLPAEVVSLKENGTMEFRDIIKQIISALYKLDINLYNKFQQALTEKELEKFFTDVEREELLRTGLLVSEIHYGYDEETLETTIPQIVKEIISAIKTEITEIEKNRQPYQEELVLALLEKITSKVISPKEAAIDRLLKRWEYSLRDHPDYLTNYPGSIGNFREYLKTILENYLDGKLELNLGPTFLPEISAQNKRDLMRDLFIPLKFWVEYLPYFAITLPISNISPKRSSFFEKFMDVFLGSISLQLSGGSGYVEFSEILNSKELEKDVLDKANRLYLKAVEKEPEKEDIQAILLSDYRIREFSTLNQETIIDYILSLQTEEKLRLQLSKETKQFWVEQFMMDSGDLPSFRQAVIIVIKYGLNNSVIWDLAKVISKKKQGDDKYASSKEFYSVLKNTKNVLNNEQLKLLIEDSSSTGASSSLEVDSIPGGIALDDSIFALERRGPGMVDFSSSPISAQNIPDFSGLTIGEILIVHPQGN